MNCSEFQNQLFEYVEGSLPANEKAAADVHLAGCAACREELEREMRAARFLSHRLQQETEAIALSLEIRNRIIKSRPGIVSWKKFAWPLGLAACLLVIGKVLLMKPAPAESDFVAVQVSYQVPVCKFHRDGDKIIDRISYETVVVNGTIEKPHSPL